jgi:hypothetical protein
MTRRGIELLCLAALVPAAFVGLAHSIAAQATPGEDFRARVAYAVDGDTLRVREPDGELAWSGSTPPRTSSRAIRLSVARRRLSQKLRASTTRSQR